MIFKHFNNKLSPELIDIYVIYTLKPARHAPNEKQAKKYVAVLTKKAALFNNLMIRAISFTIIRIF